MAIISEQRKLIKKNNKLYIKKRGLILYSEKELNDLPNVRISNNFSNIKLNEQVISDIVFDGTVDINFNIKEDANNVKQFKIMLKTENEEYMDLGVVEFVSDVYSYSYSLPFIADTESKYYITCESEDGLQGNYSEKTLIVKLDSGIILDENNHIIFDEHDNALIDEHREK